MSGLGLGRGVKRVMPKLLIVAGLVLVAAGVLWAVAERFGVMRLPGDVVIELENFRVYIPVTSSLSWDKKEASGVIL